MNTEIMFMLIIDDNFHRSFGDFHEILCQMTLKLILFVFTFSLFRFAYLVLSPWRNLGAAKMRYCYLIHCNF